MLTSLCLYLSLGSVWVADSGVRLIEGWGVGVVQGELLMDLLNNCQDNNCETVALPFNNWSPWKANGGECGLYCDILSAQDLLNSSKKCL